MAKTYTLRDPDGFKSSLCAVEVLENGIVVAHITEKGNLFPIGDNNPIFSPEDLRELSRYCIKQRKISEQKALAEKTTP